MRRAFVTYLGTDTFYPGVIALNASIRQWQDAAEFLVLVSKMVSADILSELSSLDIGYKVIEEIENPHHIPNDVRNFRCMFTKLRVFELYQFDKLIYIDADMLACNSLARLFECPSVSAVVAGGLSAANREWKDLNAGLMVIEPSKKLTDEIYSAIERLPSSDGSDQGFLNAFFPNWPLESHLHLDHRYNVPLAYLDEYCTAYPKEIYFTYKRKKLSTNIFLLHFWGRYKPWDIDPRELKKASTEKWEQALSLWHDTYANA